MSLPNLTDFFAQESCCADLDKWKEILFDVVSVLVLFCVALSLCYGILRLLKRLLKRKVTWMERIKQKYNLLNITWRGDCGYNITYQGTSNTDDTNDDKLVKVLPQRDIDTTTGSSGTLDPIDKSTTVENDDKLVKASPQRNIDNTDGNSSTLDPIDKSTTVKNDYKLVKTLPQRDIDNTDGSSDTVYLIDQSITLENDDELVKALHKRDTGKRVLFVGEPSIGKSHLFRSIASRWANGEILKDVILIHLQLDHVPREACILKEFLNLMKRDNIEEEMYSLILELQRKDSILLLDGISNWSTFCNNTSNNVNRNEAVLTVEELLEPNNTKFKKMKVWVTSRNVEADMKVMKGNYTKVNLNGFNEEQRKKFFKKFLEMEIRDKKVRKLSRKVQQQYTCKLIDEKDYVNNMLCKEAVLTRSPVVFWFLATMFCSEEKTSDVQSKIKTHLTGFLNMVETTRGLLESEKVDFDLLVCLLEVGTKHDGDYRTCAKLLRMKKLVFNHIKHEYFQEAMLRLLKTLRETERVITSLTVYGECPIKLFSCLPKIEERLVFYNCHLREIDFIAVIRTLSKQDLNIEFHNSEVPETFPVIKLLDYCSTKNVSVFRYEGGINPEKLSWAEEQVVWKKIQNEEEQY